MWSSRVDEQACLLAQQLGGTVVLPPRGTPVGAHLSVVAGVAAPPVPGVPCWLEIPLLTKAPCTRDQEQYPLSASGEGAIQQGCDLGSWKGFKWAQVYF